MGGRISLRSSAFLDDATIDAAIDRSRPLELPPRHDAHSYSAFVDPSGGRHDTYALCVGHEEGESFVCDVVRGFRPPFDPQSATKEFAALLKQYKVSEVAADSYSGEWVASALEDEGITYERAEKSKSQLYLEALPLFTRGAISIPNHPQLIRELRLLERATHRGGKDTVDHPRRGSDDCANALCGCAALTQSTRFDESWRWLDGPHRDPRDEWRRQRLLNYCLGGGRAAW